MGAAASHPDAATESRLHRFATARTPSQRVYGGALPQAHGAVVAEHQPQHVAVDDRRLHLLDPSGHSR